MFDRRQFAVTAVAAVSGFFLSATSFPRTPGETRLLFYGGRRDFRYGVAFQNELRQVVSVLRGYGLPVTAIKRPRFTLRPDALNRLPPLAATFLDPQIIVHSGRLPAAFGVPLRKWQAAVPERLVALSRANLFLEATTPEEMKKLCAQL